MTEENDKSVYIAAVKKILPKMYPAEYVAGMFYSRELCGESVHKLAKRAARSVGIENRPSVLDWDEFPERKLADDEYKPLNWGIGVLEHFSDFIDMEDIGYLTSAYNSSSHEEYLPNLSCQIALAGGLDLDSAPKEYVHCGCAGGICAIASAFEFCRKHDKAAVVITYDQCHWNASPLYDMAHEDFKSSLRSHLLFGDGAVAVLMIPKSMKGNYDGHLVRIVDFKKDFHLGDVIKVSDGRFLTGDGVKDLMPSLVSTKIIKPLLEKYNLDTDSISEWSIHQGGMPILESFIDEGVLGLRSEQLSRSRLIFQKYGNLSSPSCLLVLESFFNEANGGSNGNGNGNGNGVYLRDNGLESNTLSTLQRTNGSNNDFGMLVGFGAGYYLGGMLYCRD